VRTIGTREFLGWGKLIKVGGWSEAQRVCLILAGGTVMTALAVVV
jgi:hypothetical protein